MMNNTHPMTTPVFRREFALGTWTFTLARSPQRICEKVVDFAVGTRWVFALERIREVPPDGFDSRTPNFSYGRVDDYILSHCGGYWLNYSGEAVTGSLVDAPRWARDPDMTPVHMDLLRAFVAGKASADALREAAKEDPAVTELMLNTRAFLRGDPEVDEP